MDIEAQTGPAQMSHLMDEMLAQEPRPRVLLRTYDVIALGAVAALRQKGLRVPEDIAVTGCAGVSAAADPTYDFTTLGLHHDQMGHHAVDMVLRVAKGENLAGSSVVVQPELMVRSSA